MFPTLRKSSVFLATCLFALGADLAAGNAQDSPSKEPTYWQDIQPIFRKNCAYCHAERHVKKLDVSGGLALDTYEAVRKGSTRPVIKPGDSNGSLLVELLLTKDVKKRMPLDGDPLPAEQITLIRRWIDAGAKEGKRPADAENTVVKKSGPRRRLDVTLATGVTPPPGVLGKASPAPLALRLKVGPLAPVTAVAFSPDGSLLATGSYGLVTVWDLRKTQPRHTLTNVLGAINDLAFSPDGKLLAVGGGQPSAKGDLRLYRVSDGQLLAASREHTDVVFSVAFSPDGTKLASASFDTTVRLWDAATLKPERTLTGHSDFVYAVAFSPDGKMLASVSKDRTVRLTDMTTGKGLFTLGGMEQDVMAVAFNRSGSHVISSGFETALMWWNTKTGEKEKTQGGHATAVHEITFSKDGSLIASAGADHTARLWNGTSGAVAKVFQVGSPVYAVDLSPDKRLLATGSFDGQVRLWDVSSGKQLATLLSLPGDDGGWLALSGDGYLDASDGLIRSGQWVMRGSAVEPDPVLRALRQPERVGDALGGKKVPPPAFGK